MIEEGGKGGGRGMEEGGMVRLLRRAMGGLGNNGRRLRE